MKKIIAFSLLLLASPVFAGWTILFNSASGASSYTCTAYESHHTQAQPEIVTTSQGNAAEAVSPLYDFTSWTAVTCNVLGLYPGSLNTRYAEVPDSSIDPATPGIRVIACIRAVDSIGNTSTCANAQLFAPYDLSDPVAGGFVNAPVADASSQ